MDKLGTSYRVDGKRNPEYKDPNKQEIKLYESFLSGNHEEFIVFLNEGTRSTKSSKISRMMKWNEENGDKILKYVKDIPELYGYSTEGIILKLPPTFDTSNLGELTFELEDTLEVTLPENMSIEQGKLLSGGTPSAEIERTLFAKIFKAPKYNTGVLAPSNTSYSIETINDSFAIDYLEMVVTKISGQDRNNFLPVIATTDVVRPSRQKKIHQLLFGTGKSTSGSTTRMYPALDYILRNDSLDLNVGFVKTQTKQSLQEKEFINRSIIENSEIKTLYDKFVKTNNGKTTGFSKFKEAVYDAELGKEYEDEMQSVIVRRYTLSSEVRDALVAMMDSKADATQQKLVRKEFRHLFSMRGFKTSVRTMTNEEKEYGDVPLIKNALLAMEGDGDSVSIKDKSSITTLEFLFSDIDDDPLGNYIANNRNNWASKLRMKDTASGLTQNLEFSDLLLVIIQLEKKLLSSVNLEDTLDDIFTDIDSPKEAEEEFKNTIMQTYSKVRDELLLKIKTKMVQVMSEPILSEKKGGTQPYEWIAGDGGK